MAKKKAPARRPAKRATTALAKRASVVKRADVLPPAQDLERVVTADGMNLGALGLVEIKLTVAEEKILNEPIEPERVAWRASKRGGPADIPYYPHQEYTRWFNRAFGRTGWALVPVGKPSVTPGSKPGQQTITCPYILHIHGKPVAFAMGEQEYYDSNEQQTYGDALESTVASALRRCAKRLGVGLELWDKGFLRSLPKQSPPARTAPRPQTNHPPAGHHPQADEVITQKQRQRLWMIIRNSGRSDDEIKRWLERRLRISATKAIKRRDYDFVCSSIEAPGDLPLDREPGEEE
jgi:hypothetical protein